MSRGLEKEKYTQEHHDLRVRKFNEHKCEHPIFCGQIENSMESPNSTAAHEMVAFCFFGIGGFLGALLF